MRFKMRQFGLILGTILCFSLSADARMKEKILFIGSSTIGHWTSLQTDFPNFEPINEGVNGTKYTDLIEYAGELMRKHQPRRVVIYSGDNDLADGDTPADVVLHFSQVVRILRESKRNVLIDVISIKPSPARAALLPQIEATNALLRPAAEALHVTFIDTHHAMRTADGGIRTELFDANEETLLHMNSRGYEIWRDIVGATLNREDF